MTQPIAQRLADAVIQQVMGGLLSKQVSADEIRQAIYTALAQSGGEGEPFDVHKTRAVADGIERFEDWWLAVPESALYQDNGKPKSHEAIARLGWNAAVVRLAQPLRAPDTAAKGDADVSGTYACPKCGLCTPHVHSLFPCDLAFEQVASRLWNNERISLSVAELRRIYRELLQTDAALSGERNESTQDG